jgi:hypothetical protein
VVPGQQAPAVLGDAMGERGAVEHPSLHRAALGRHTARVGEVHHAFDLAVEAAAAAVDLGHHCRSSFSIIRDPCR